MMVSWHLLFHFQLLTKMKVSFQNFKRCIVIRKSHYLENHIRISFLKSEVEVVDAKNEKIGDNQA